MFAPGHFRRSAVYMLAHGHGWQRRGCGVGMFTPGHDLQLQGRAVGMFAPEHVYVSLANVFHVGPVARAASGAPAA
eukprot:10375612-Prorocentrum_lima.AAC.1